MFFSMLVVGFLAGLTAYLAMRLGEALNKAMQEPAQQFNWRVNYK